MSLKSQSANGRPTRIRFWGVRGSIPTPGPATVLFGGNTSCVEVRTEDQIIILDAGTGLRPLGRELMAEFGDQPLELTMLLTHMHWDHIQGLPFFLPLLKPRSRLRILGYEGARHGLENLLTSQMEKPFFPIGMSHVVGNIRIEERKQLTFKLGRVRVQAGKANHPGTCVGYRLFARDGSLAFFPDNEPHLGPDRRPAPASAAAHEQARAENQKMIAFLRGVDVLIMDAQYDAKEYLDHIGWGHGCLDDVVALALEAKVKQLFLFHHDPDHDDAKVGQMVSRARELAAERRGILKIDAAREGLVFEFGCEKLLKGLKRSMARGTPC
jgi:phosphoribosyl 1,2-cyclic phosphodiesterase